MSRLSDLPIGTISSIQNEMLVSMEFIRQGLEVQGQLEYRIVQKFFVMQNLAQGLERYFKVMFVIIHIDKYKKLPDKKEFQSSMGHSILKILEAIFREGTHHLSYSNADLIWGRSYIEQDNVFKSILTQLDYFGRLGRYYDMDILNGKQQDQESPETIWEKIEDEVALSIYDTQRDRIDAVIKNIDEYYSKVYPEMINHIKWGIYAVTKFSMTGLSDTGEETEQRTRGFPQHFLDYIFQFYPPPSVYGRFL